MRLLRSRLTFSKKTIMQTVMFRSHIPKLFVSFPAETFGLGADVEGQLKPYPNAKFQQGALAVQSSKYLELLRKHPSNKQNGGMEFWEESAIETQALLVAQGEILVKSKGELITEEDRDALEHLQKCLSMKALALTPVKSKLLRAYTHLVTRFEVLGVRPLNMEMKTDRIKAGIMELLSVLEDSGIKSDSISEAA